MDKKKFAEGTSLLSKMMMTTNMNQKGASPLIITNNSKLSM